MALCNRGCLRWTLVISLLIGIILNIFYLVKRLNEPEQDSFFGGDQQQSVIGAKVAISIIRLGTLLLGIYAACTNNSTLLRWFAGITVLLSLPGMFTLSATLMPFTLQGSSAPISMLVVFFLVGTFVLAVSCCCPALAWFLASAIDEEQHAQQTLDCVDLAHSGGIRPPPPQPLVNYPNEQRVYLYAEQQT